MHCLRYLLTALYTPVIVLAFSQPAINNFSPGSGPVGTAVTISGTGFSPISSSNIVMFGAIKAVVTAASATSLTVSVPMAAPSNSISVSVAGFTAYSKNAFNITFPGPGTVSSSSFSAKNGFTTTHAQIGTSTCDLDGDGKPDVIVTNSGTNIIHFYRNISTPNKLLFAQQVAFKINHFNHVVNFFDLDADGRPEMIAGGGTTDTIISVYKNLSTPGNISFVFQTSLPGYPNMQFGDIDQDGRPEIIMRTTSKNIQILKNISTPSGIAFEMQPYILTGIPSNVGLHRLSLVYADDDIYPELAFLSNEVTIIKNLSQPGNIAFGERVSYPTGITGTLTDMAIADIDMDSRQDIAITGLTTIAVLSNAGNGAGISFNAAQTFSTGGNARMICMADFNGDGKTDLALANQSGAAVLKNTSIPGSISFETPVLFNIATNIGGASSAEDIDGDTKPDLVIADRNMFSVLLNQVNEPAITSFVPAIATAGTVVSVTGTNFTNITGVFFGDVPATSFTVVSPTLITAVAPNRPSGNINISVSNIYGINLLSGLIFNPPAIASVTPYSGFQNNHVLISGNNFNTNAAANMVYFGSVKAAVTSATGTSIMATVPASADYRQLTVNNNTLIAGAAVPFISKFGNGEGITFDSTSFESKSEPSTSSIPLMADFDGDGKIDQAVLEPSANMMYVSRNISLPGEVKLDTKQSYSVAGNARAFCTGDFNGDGKPDIAVANFNTSTRSIYIFQNISTPGTITFADRYIISTGNLSNDEIYSIAAADMDGDGRVDIVLSLYSTTIVVLRNTLTENGVLSFAPKWEFKYKMNGNQYYPVRTDIFVTDFNNDNKPDIVIGSDFVTTPLLFKNNSTPGNLSLSEPKKIFIGADTTTTNPEVKAICIADINYDGKPDLVSIARDSLFIAVNMNISTYDSILFSAPQKNLTPVSSDAIAASDLDGDGMVEVVVTRGINVFVYKNKTVANNTLLEKQGEYTLATAIGVESNHIAIGDLDGDNKPEICVWNYFNFYTNLRRINILRNLVQGPHIKSFTPQLADPGTVVTIYGHRFTGATQVLLAGIPAIFTVVADTVITAIVQSGSPASSLVSVITPGGIASMAGFTYSNPIPHITTISPLAGAAGSAVVISGKKFGVSIDDNAVFFGAVKATVIQASDTSLTVIVPVGASYKPISITTSAHLTAWSPHPFKILFTETGTGLDTKTFSDSVTHLIPNFSEHIELDDWDNDGKTDITATSSYTVNTLCIFKNATKHNDIKTEQRIDVPATIIQGAYLYTNCTDMDGDGKKDMITAFTYRWQPNSGTKYDSLTLYRNTSTGPGDIKFSTRQNITAADYIKDIESSDLDGDGRADIVSFNNNNTISIFRNLSTPGNITLDARKDVQLIATSATGIIKDLDGDRKPDIIAATVAFITPARYGLSIFRNTSIPGFISLANRVDSVFNGPGDIAVEDLDGDDKPDLIRSNSTDKTISIYKNTSTPGNISFGPATVLLQTTDIVGNITFCDLDGDGKPELIGRKSMALLIFKNTSHSGTVSFAPPITITTQKQPVNIYTADITNDGIPDIVTANIYSSRSITLFKNSIGHSVTKTCASGTSFNAGITGSTYQWQLKTGSGTFSNIENNANYTGANTATLHLTNIPTSWYGNTYRCITQEGSNSNLFKLQFTAAWTGALSNAWETAGNWNCNRVPDENTDVIISMGSPVLNSTTSIRSIRVQQTGKLTINAGNILHVIQ